MVFEAQTIKYEVTIIVKSMLANKTISAVSITYPWNTPIKSKVTHEPHLGMEAFNKIRILVGLGPKMVRTDVIQAVLSHFQIWWFKQKSNQIPSFLSLTFCLKIFSTLCMYM